MAPEVIATIAAQLFLCNPTQEDYTALGNESVRRSIERLKQLIRYSLGGKAEFEISVSQNDIASLKDAITGAYQDQFFKNELTKLVNEITKNRNINPQSTTINDVVGAVSSSVSGGQNVGSMSGGVAAQRIDNFRLQADDDTHKSCYVFAEISNYLPLHHATTLDVSISTEIIDFQSTQMAKGGSVEVEPDKTIIVQVIAIKNFNVIGDDRVELYLPAEGKLYRFYCDLKSTHLGEGEIWIVVRQLQMPLMTLKLKPLIIESRLHLEQRYSDKQLSTVSIDGVIAEFPPLTAPIHQLRIIEQNNGGDITYRYELESPSLELLHSSVSRPITINRQEYIEAIYQEIESRWVSSEDDTESFTAELRAFGGHLFDELFPVELRSLLWDYHSQIKSVMVLATEPFIPWELVHLKNPKETHLPAEIKFLCQLGLVRWLYGSFPPQTIKVRPGRVCYTIPHYPVTQYRLPQAERESKFLEESFQAQAIPPNSKAVRKLLQSGNFDLFHFAGHGRAEQNNISNAKLLMEGRLDGNHYIHSYFSSTTVEQFSRLKSSDGNRPLVVLNACQVGRKGCAFTGISGFAQAFLKGGAGAFIGPLWSVGDYPARAFTEALYRSLNIGLTLSEATVKARQEARKSGDATWLAYAVYGHPNLRLKILE
ncbi:MAG: CHAT domain-containing protein [Cyanobacteria bacterium J06634_5]